MDGVRKIGRRNPENGKAAKPKSHEPLVDSVPAFARKLVLPVVASVGIGIAAGTLAGCGGCFGCGGEQEPGADAAAEGTKAPSKTPGKAPESSETPSKAPEKAEPAEGESPAKAPSKSGGDAKTAKRSKVLPEQLLLTDGYRLNVDVFAELVPFLQKMEAQERTNRDNPEWRLTTAFLSSPAALRRLKEGNFLIREQYARYKREYGITLRSEIDFLHRYENVCIMPGEQETRLLTEAGVKARVCKLPRASGKATTKAGETAPADPATKAGESDEATGERPTKSETIFQGSERSLRELLAALCRRDHAIYYLPPGEVGPDGKRGPGHRNDFAKLFRSNAAKLAKVSGASWKVQRISDEHLQQAMQDTLEQAHKNGWLEDTRSGFETFRVRQEVAHMLPHVTKANQERLLAKTNQPLRNFLLKTPDREVRLSKLDDFLYDLAEHIEPRGEEKAAFNLSDVGDQLTLKVWATDVGYFRQTDEDGEEATGGEQAKALSKTATVGGLSEFMEGLEIDVPEKMQKSIESELVKQVRGLARNDDGTYDWSKARSKMRAYGIQVDDEGNISMLDRMRKGERRALEGKVNDLVGLFLETEAGAETAETPETTEE